MIFKPTEVKPLDKYRIWLQYSDGAQGEINLSHLAGKGLFAAWDSENIFNNVHIDEETKAIAWNTTLELSLHDLYM